MPVCNRMRCNYYSGIAILGKKLGMNANGHTGFALNELKAVVGERL